MAGWLSIPNCSFLQDPSVLFPQVNKFFNLEYKNDPDFKAAQNRQDPDSSKPKAKGKEKTSPKPKASTVSTRGKKASQSAASRGRGRGRHSK